MAAAGVIRIMFFYYTFHNSCSGNGIWYCFLISIIVGVRTQISFKIMWHSNKIHCDGLGPQIIWYLTISNLKYLNTVPMQTTRHQRHYVSRYTKTSTTRRDSLLEYAICRKPDFETLFQK